MAPWCPPGTRSGRARGLLFGRLGADRLGRRPTVALAVVIVPIAGTVTHSGALAGQPMRLAKSALNQRVGRKVTTISSRGSSSRELAT